MATVYDGIDADMAAWIERQPVFFVATAPLAADGLVNLSPKGTGGYARVRTSAPESVTTSVCSNCAVRLRSLVSTVQPSSHMSYS